MRLCKATMPSDKLLFEKLDNSKYTNWSCMLKMYLKCGKLCKYITCDRPAVIPGVSGAADDTTAYDEKSEEAHTTIALYISKGQISIIRRAIDAKLSRHITTEIRPHLLCDKLQTTPCF